MHSPVGVEVKCKPGVTVRRLVSVSDQKVYYLKRCYAPWSLAYVRRCVGRMVRGRRWHTEAFFVQQAAGILGRHKILVMNVVAWGEARALFGLFPRCGFVLCEAVEGSELAEDFSRGDMACRVRIMHDLGKLLACLHAGGFYLQLRFTDVICARDRLNGQREGLTLIDLDFKGRDISNRYDPVEARRDLAKSMYYSIRGRRGVTATEVRAFVRQYRRGLRREGISVGVGLLSTVRHGVDCLLCEHHKDGPLRAMFPAMPKRIKDIL